MDLKELGVTSMFAMLGVILLVLDVRIFGLLLLAPFLLVMISISMSKNNSDTPNK